MPIKIENQQNFQFETAKSKKCKNCGNPYCQGCGKKNIDWEKTLADLEEMEEWALEQQEIKNNFSLGKKSGARKL